MKRKLNQNKKQRNSCLSFCKLSGTYNQWCPHTTELYPPTKIVPNNGTPHQKKESNFTCKSQELTKKNKIKNHST